MDFKRDHTEEWGGECIGWLPLGNLVQTKKKAAQSGKQGSAPMTTRRKI